MHDPNERHMDDMNQILAYLKSSPDKSILFSKHRHLDIKGYTNLDFARSKVDKKFTSRYLTFLKGNLVTWKNKKQNVISLSSAKHEYCALHHAIITELSWLEILLCDLGLSLNKPMNMFCDHTAAIVVANSPIQNDQIKQIELNINYIKNIIWILVSSKFHTSRVQNN